METLSIKKEQGHLIVSIGNNIAIVDTGSPYSISIEPFSFLGEHHSPPQSFMGVTTQHISELSGINIDILIGCDILSRHTLRIRWRDNAIDIGDNIADGSISLKFTPLLGIPVFPITLECRSTNVIFDTGAHLSYINPELVYGQIPSGQREDFHPFAGKYTVPTYFVSTVLDDSPINIEYGILPNNLQGMMDMVMNRTDSSAVIGTQLLEFFDCTLSWKRNIISFTRT